MKISITRLVAVALSTVLLTACGDTDTATRVVTTPINTLKIAYLDGHKLTGKLTFSISDQPVLGEIKLLNEKTGMYSYIATTNGNDSFTYTITDENRDSVETLVKVEVGEVPVTLNGVEQIHFSSNLPIVIVDTGSRGISKETKIKGSMTIFEPDTTNRSNLTLLPSYSSYIEINVRGSSSDVFPKKQYSVDTETWDEEDDDISLIGMPKEHKWILHAPYSDKSLMRNYLAYHKTREIDEKQYYAVRSKYVELLTRIGTSYRYDGVYILMEKIKRDKKRLKIAKLSDDENELPDITGGYILKYDRADGNNYFLTKPTNTKFVYVYPKISKITDAQKTYISNYVSDVENALKSSDFNDKNSENYYKNWIDEDSFIVHILSRELFRDIDTWGFSEYLHKDKDKKLSLSAVWDFNLSMGNNNYGHNGSYEGWNFKGNSGLQYWITRLMSAPDFHDKVKLKWELLRGGIWSDDNMSSFILKKQNLLTESATRNFERWPVLGKYIWPNRKACTENGIDIYCKTFDTAVNEHLKTWLFNRANWMDDNM